MTHKEIVAIAGKWLKRHQRNITVSNCPLVVTELVAMTAYGETPDVLGWNYSHSVLIEVKTSRQDFRNDAKKYHKRFGSGMGQFKYYCCPIGIIKEEDLPNGWGLLYVNDKGKIEIIKKADKDKEADLYSERAMLLSIIRNARNVVEDEVAPSGAEEILGKMVYKLNEIVTFYGQIIDSTSVFLHIHGINASKEEIAKGKRLRDEFETLKSEYANQRTNKR